MRIPPEQQEELDRLTAEYDALVESCDDELDPETNEKLDELAERIEMLGEGAFEWRAEDRAVAGALVSVGHDGAVAIERGLVRPEDKATLRTLTKAQPAETDLVTMQPASSLSAKLIEELTAERTAALRAMLDENKDVALAAVAHALALPVFYPHAFRTESCLGLRLRNRDLRSSHERIAESGGAVLLNARETAWVSRLPEEPDALFGWLLSQDMETVTDLVTFCAAVSIDAVQSKQDRPNAPRLVHADELAAALGLDMTAWWEPTKERYLGRVPRRLVLEAVAEGVSLSAAENLGTIKAKAELVDHAAERLKGKGWLPAILRPMPVSTDEAEPLAEAAE